MYTYATGMLTCMYMRHIQVCILSCIYTRINAYTYAHASVYVYAMGIYAKGSIYTQQTRLEGISGPQVFAKKVGARGVDAVAPDPACT